MNDSNDSSDDEGGYQGLSSKAVAERASRAASREAQAATQTAGQLSRPPAAADAAELSTASRPVEKKPINFRLVKAATGIEDETELLNITTLRLSWQGITHIDGLELYSNVRDLYLQHNQIATIENLDVLPNLEFLALGSNKIRGVGDGLRQLRKLEVLDLTDNHITAFPPGSLPRSLRVINVSGNPFVSKNRHTYRRILLDMLPECLCIDGTDVEPEEAEASTLAVMKGAGPGAASGAGKASLKGGRFGADAAADLEAEDLLDGLGPLTISGAESKRALDALRAKRYGAGGAGLPTSPASSNASPSQRRRRALEGDDDDDEEEGARGGGAAGDEEGKAAADGDSGDIASYLDRRDALVQRFKARAIEQQKRTDALLEAMEERSRLQLKNAASRLREQQTAFSEAAAKREKETSAAAKRTLEAFKAIGRPAAAAAAAGDDASGADAAGGRDGSPKPSVSPLDPDML